MPRSWFALRDLARRRREGSRKPKPSPRRDDLTLHRCARGLREERDKQEIDEVDEGQGVVPEHARCGDRKKKGVAFHQNQ